MKNFYNLFMTGLSATALSFALVGCNGDDTGTDSDTDATSNPTTTQGTTEGGTDTEGGSETETESGGSETNGGGAGFCVQGCSEAADCCPMGAMDCPGDYPFNYSCDAGVCAFGGCSNDDQCTLDGLLPDNVCREIGGIGSCFEPCEEAADCMAPFVCVGEADDGTKFCAVESDENGGCESDEECGGFGVCNTVTGACECTGDEDCTGIDGLVCK